MRLIDADATLRGIDTTIALLRVASGSDKIKNKAVDMVQHARDLVAKMEVIDAVPVVRCKDCKHITPVEGGLPLCALHNIACAYNDFCSYGERKEV